MPETIAEKSDRAVRSAVKVIAIAIALGLAGLAVVRGVRLIESWTEPRVDLQGPSVVAPDAARSEKGLRFAVAGMVSAETTFFNYRRLVQKISQAVGREYVFILRPSYADVRAALTRGEIDVAIVCTGTYLHALASGRLRLLAQPEFEEGLEYRCVVIVPADADSQSLEDLRGKTMAFTDRESNTGYIVARAELRNRGLEPGTFFGKTIFTGSHDRSIQAVAVSVVDAAAVDYLVLESMCREDPRIREQARVVWSSEPFGPPPVVVPVGIDPGLEESLRRTFLSLHEEPEGRGMLAELGIRRFAPPDPELYESAIATFRRSGVEGAGTWP